jgi:zinc/manganese transport system permease protein
LSLLLTAVIGFAVTWAGLVAAFYWPYPLGFFVTSFAFAGFLLAHAARRVATALADRSGSATIPAGAA